MDFKEYKLGTVQTFLSLLTKCEQTELTIPELKVEVKKYIETKVPNDTSKLVLRKKHMVQCPECANGHLIPIHNEDNSVIWACKNCRYSEIREGNNVK